jgi:CDP-diacylglycerol--glycerol-3-phosphate 3-phosphatidyltransferase
VALIGLSMLGELWWWVTILIIAREVGVTLVRFVVLKHGVIPASRGGKLKTMFQMGGIVLFLLPIPADVTALWLTRNVVMGIVVGLTVVTGLDYIVKAYRTRSDSKAAKARRAERRAARAAGQPVDDAHPGAGSGAVGEPGSATAPGPAPAPGSATPPGSPTAPGPAPAPGTTEVPPEPGA